MSERGLFVTFEGGEGAGKSTVIAAAALALSERGRMTLTTREPGTGALGIAVRSLLLDQAEISARSELFLFLADRANHCAQIIEPALNDGHTVLCDRHADSTLVYQSLVRGLDEPFVRGANAFATQGLVPDITFLLDLPAEVGLSRLKEKNRLDREPLEFHQRVRAGFLRLAAEEPNRFRVIDATQSPEEVLTCVLREFKP